MLSSAPIAAGGLASQPTTGPVVATGCEQLEVRDHSGGLPRRPRVLLLAYACNPEQGSEPGVGWNRAVEAARYCDTWVVCEEHRYGPPLRDYLRAHGPVPGLEFVYVPRPSWHRWVKLIPGLDYLSYNAWHRRVF